jgi:hypothetical protein
MKEEEKKTKSEEQPPYDGPRRLFTKTTVDKDGNEKSHPSAVLRAKKDEDQTAATERLTKMGWNMDAPHSFEDGVFRTTDKKVKKKKLKPESKPDAAEADTPPKEDDAKEAKADDADTPETDESEDKS